MRSIQERVADEVYPEFRRLKRKMVKMFYRSPGSSYGWKNTRKNVSQWTNKASR